MVRVLILALVLWLREFNAHSLFLKKECSRPHPITSLISKEGVRGTKWLMLADPTLLLVFALQCGIYVGGSDTSGTGRISGSVKWNVAPLPGILSTQIVPPCR